MIAMMRWIIDVDEYFYTYSCRDDWRVLFALNLLCLGVKDWWKFMIANLSPTKKDAVTWDQFVEMFREEYVPLVERV